MGSDGSAGILGKTIDGSPIEGNVMLGSSGNEISMPKSRVGNAGKSGILGKAIDGSSSEGNVSAGSAGKDGISISRAKSILGNAGSSGNSGNTGNGIPIDGSDGNIIAGIEQLLITLRP